MFAADICRQRVSRMLGTRYWRWLLDEMCVKMNGEMVYLWRAVGHEGEILESYVTVERDKSAPLDYMKKAPKCHGKAETIITDRLKSYPAVMKEFGNDHRHELGMCLNERAEIDTCHFDDEKVMQRFSAHDANAEVRLNPCILHNRVNSERHLVNRETFKARRSAALAEWLNFAALICESWRPRAPSGEQFASD